MSSLEQRLEQDRDWISWVPGGDAEKYDTRNPVIGTVVDGTEIDGTYGPTKVMIVEVEGGQRLGIWLSRTVLRNEVVSANPQWGERIGIKYLGEQTPKSGGAAFHNYTVRMDRSAETRTDRPNWSDGPPVDPIAETGRTVNDGEGGQTPAPSPIPEPDSRRAPAATPAAPDDDIPF